MCGCSLYEFLKPLIIKINNRPKGANHSQQFFKGFGHSASVANPASKKRANPHSGDSMNNTRPPPTNANPTPPTRHHEPNKPDNGDAHIWQRAWACGGGSLSSLEARCLSLPSPGRAGGRPRIIDASLQQDSIVACSRPGEYLRLENALQIRRYWFSPPLRTRRARS
jgi:hypothetical protein